LIDPATPKTRRYNTL